MTRAERRHRRMRKLAYAARKLALWKIPTGWAGYWADNMAKCSCPGCKDKQHRKTYSRKDVGYDYDCV